MTVLRGCVGCRTVAVPATATGRDLKERIFAETGFPVAEQRLWRGDREVGQLQACPLRWVQSPAGGRKFTGSCLSRNTDAQMIQESFVNSWSRMAGSQLWVVGCFVFCIYRRHDF